MPINLALQHRASGLKQRLRLFNAVVGRSLLWGAESWTLTVAEKKALQAVQRSMLRRFAAPRKRAEEEWLAWIRRATHIALANAETARVHCWVKEHLRMKWRWAGHLARMRKYRPDSWALKATVWRGTAWQKEMTEDTELFRWRPLRPRPGRWGRWENNISSFYQSVGRIWTEEAINKQHWQSLTEQW